MCFAVATDFVALLRKVPNPIPERRAKVCCDEVRHGYVISMEDFSNSWQRFLDALMDVSACVVVLLNVHRYNDSFSRALPVDFQVSLCCRWPTEPRSHVGPRGCPNRFPLANGFDQRSDDAFDIRLLSIAEESVDAVFDDFWDPTDGCCHNREPTRHCLQNRDWETFLK